MYTYTYVDQTCVDDFVVVNPSTQALVGGLSQSDFTVAIYDPTGTDRAVGAGAVSWSITEKKAGTGYYNIIFIPDIAGDWVVSVIHNTYFPYGKSANYRAVATDYYGTGSGGTTDDVTNGDLLAFILGLY